MPSDKAKLNKALMATCVACNKPISTESAVSLTGVEDGHHRQYTVCNACANGGCVRRDSSGCSRFAASSSRSEKLNFVQAFGFCAEFGSEVGVCD